MNKKILIVEDEKNIVDILCFNLMREGYETLEAYDGQTGLQLAREQSPDLILLDLMLPKLNGFEVCRALREDGDRTPILMLTAREQESDKVQGLELGADDYITKPFSMRELLARIKTNLRREDQAPVSHHDTSSDDPLCCGALAVSQKSASVTKNGQPVDLTAREYELLRYLIVHKGEVFSREALMEQVWNYEFVGDVRTVDVTVRRLREKIEDTPASPTYIITRRGMGYLFSDKV